ncbi:MAG: tetratricopeptide repeat protein [Bacteroidota bacterium]
MKKLLFVIFLAISLGNAIFAQDTEITAGLNALRSGDYSAAFNLYNKFLSTNQKYAPAFYGRAIASYKLKDYGKSLEDCKKAIALDDKYHDAYFLAGLNSIELNDYKNAIIYFSDALSINPNNTKYLYSRANAYYFAQMDNEAISDYSRVIELEPSFGLAYYGRGIAYYMANKFALAKIDLENYVALNANQDNLQDEALRILKIIERANK